MSKYVSVLSKIMFYLVHDAFSRGADGVRGSMNDGMQLALGFLCPIKSCSSDLQRLACGGMGAVRTCMEVNQQTLNQGQTCRPASRTKGALIGRWQQLHQADEAPGMETGKDAVGKILKQSRQQDRQSTLTN